jgi:hypothetical protein
MDENLKSSSDEWEAQKQKWDVGSDVHQVIRQLNDSFSAIARAVSIVEASNNAGYGRIGSPSLNFTRSEIEQLDEDRKRLATFCSQLHDELTELVDAPFASRMAWIADGVFAVEPDEISMVTDRGIPGRERDVTLFELISRHINEDALRDDFDNRHASLLESPSTDLKTAIVEAVFRANMDSDVSNITTDDKLLLVRYFELLYPDNAGVMNDFLAPLASDGLYEDIMNIKFITYTAPKHYQTVMFEYLPMTGIGDHNYQGSQRYSLRDNRIYVNLDVNTNNGLDDNRGPYHTFFHEVGHAIDHAMKGFETGSYASTVLFDTLEADVYDVIFDVAIRISKSNPMDAHAVMDAIRYNGDITSLTNAQRNIYNQTIVHFVEYKGFGNEHIYVTVTDVYGGFTENKIVYGLDGKSTFFRHTLSDSNGEYKNYWLDSRNDYALTGYQTLEFYAGNFASEVTRNKEQLETHTRFFPDATREMDDLIKEYADRIEGGAA